MTVRKVSLLILSSTFILGCKCPPCGYEYATAPSFPQAYYYQHSPTCGQSYYGGICPDGAEPVFSGNGYYECLKIPVTETSYRTIAAFVKVENINPDPSGINAVKLANAIEKALVKVNPTISLEDSKTRIINDKITLITKPRLDGNFTDSEAITATVNSGSREVKIEVETIRRYQTADGPIEATAPIEVSERFLKKLTAALGQQD